MTSVIRQSCKLIWTFIGYISIDNLLNFHFLLQGNMMSPSINRRVIKKSLRRAVRRKLNLTVTRRRGERHDYCSHFPIIRSRWKWKLSLIFTSANAIRCSILQKLAHHEMHYYRKISWTVMSRSKVTGAQWHCRWR